jgi:hypothetical protein
VQEPDVVAIRGRDRRLGDTGPVSLEALTVTAPQAQTGAKAVEQAAREAQAASANVVVDGEQLNDVVRARSGIAPTRRVNNRLFVLRDSVWTDLRHADSLRVVAVEPYSPAYFELLRALPELRGVAALERVVVAGARLSLKIEAGGTREWSEGELRGIVRGFRG